MFCFRLTSSYPNGTLNGSSMGMIPPYPGQGYPGNGYPGKKTYPIAHIVLLYTVVSVLSEA